MPSISSHTNPSNAWPGYGIRPVPADVYARCPDSNPCRPGLPLDRRLAWRRRSRVPAAPVTRIDRHLNGADRVASLKDRLFGEQRGRVNECGRAVWYAQDALDRPEMGVHDALDSGQIDGLGSSKEDLVGQHIVEVL